MAREKNSNIGSNGNDSGLNFEYIASDVFWLPPEARWHTMNFEAKSPESGKVIDDAMSAIERENPMLKTTDLASVSYDHVP